MSCFRPLRGRGVGVCDTLLRPGMCGPSKNYPIFVPFGAACGAYRIHPYNRVRAILRNTDAIPQLGTCEGSKNGSVYATDGGVWWGVCDTPLRPGTCGPSKNCPVFVPFGAVCGVYAIRPYDRYVRPFKKLSRFRPLRGRLWGVCDTPLQAGTCGPSKNCPVFVPFGAACGAYAIRPYNRIRAILRNTDTISRPEGRGCLGGGAVGATVCGGGGRE